MLTVLALCVSASQSSSPKTRRRLKPTSAWCWRSVHSAHIKSAFSCRNSVCLFYNEVKTELQTVESMLFSQIFFFQYILLIFSRIFCFLWGIILSLIFLNFLIMLGNIIFFYWWLFLWIFSCLLLRYSTYIFQTISWILGIFCGCFGAFFSQISLGHFTELNLTSDFRRCLFVICLSVDWWNLSNVDWKHVQNRVPLCILLWKGPDFGGKTAMRSIVTFWGHSVKLCASTCFNVNSV